MISKTGLLLSLFLISNVCKAQVELALFAGPQATSANYKVKGNQQPASYKIGAIAGAGLKVPFEHPLYFFPAVYYSLKGYKVTLKDPSFPPTELAINNNVTVHTLEISPLFHFDFSKKPSHLFIRFGPAVDFAFTGREKFDTLSPAGGVGRVVRPMVFSFGDYGRFTASGNLHLGYESGDGWMVFGFYAHGFGSMNNADGGPKILHRIMGLNFGWYMRRGRK